jgi:hypothetical protein
VSGDHGQRIFHSLSIVSREEESPLRASGERVRVRGGSQRVTYRDSFTASQDDAMERFANPAIEVGKR